MGQRGRVLLQIGPGDVLCLIVVRRDVGETCIGLTASESRIDKIHDAGNGLAGATVGDDACPSLSPLVKRHELRARTIPEVNRRQHGGRLS